jgi:hypothetical protein
MLTPETVMALVSPTAADGSFELFGLLKGNLFDEIATCRTFHEDREGLLAVHFPVSFLSSAFLPDDSFPLRFLTGSGGFHFHRADTVNSFFRPDCIHCRIDRSVCIAANFLDFSGIFRSATSLPLCRPSFLRGRQLTA